MEKNIFVNGTFDILHAGHYALLNYAKSLGSILHVAIDSDDRVKLLKGPTRPINTAAERMLALVMLKPVDHVYVFYDNVDLENTIKRISPDVMVIGGDWKGKPVIGSEYAKRLEFFDRINGYSTTQKIQDIANRG